MWLGVSPRTDTKKTFVLKEIIVLSAQNMITMLTSLVHIIGETCLHDHLLSMRVFMLIMRKTAI